MRLFFDRLIYTEFSLRNLNTATMADTAIKGINTITLIKMVVFNGIDAPFVNNCFRQHSHIYR